MAKRKSSRFTAGDGYVKTSYGRVKPKTSTRRRTTSTRQAPLPESCHYTKTAAKNAAEKMRDKKIKARVVTSGSYYCVYTVNKCRGGKKVGVKGTK